MSPPPPHPAPRQFHLLAKPTGAVCNLDCSYCFFLSKELLYPGSRFRMADDLLEAYLRQLIEAHGHAPEVVVAWQGGEPTMMGLDFFRRSVELAERYRRPGQQLTYTIQTNGTLLDDAWAAFFKQHRFLVGLSIDGPRPLHDTYRVDKGGKGSFDRVMRGLAVLQRHDVDWNALTTVNAANQDRGREVYSFLRDECGARFMQFIPIVERATEQTLAAANAGWGARVRDRPLYTQQGNLVTGRSVSPQGYGRFLIDIFEDWVRADIGEVYVQMFDVALADWYRQPPGLCVHSETCGLALALEHTGDLYSCDHFVEPDWRLGSIRQTHLLDLVASPRQEQFGRAKRDTLPRYCRDCDVRFACHGGCPRTVSRPHPVASLLDVLTVHADAIKAQGKAGVDLAIGLLLLAAGGLLATGRLRGRQPAPVPAGTIPPGQAGQPDKKDKKDKKDSWAARALAEPRLGLAMLVGALVGLPGASYLTALQHLIAGKYSTATLVIAVVVFVIIEFLLIIIPFAFLELRPEATKALLRRSQDWLLRHAWQLMVGVALLLGGYLTVSGLVRLS